MNKQFYSDKIFSPSDIDYVLSQLPEYDVSKNVKKGFEYIDVPCGFDIETSSYRNEHDDKIGIMYEWTFGIDGYIIIGREWEEFVALTEKLVEHFQLTGKHRLMVGVHNLAFEFQFMRKWFKWDKVFSVDKRKPVYAITNGIEFRCTLILTGLKLEKVPQDILFNWNLKKDVGDLDYNKIRHSKTVLTKKELKYCVDDVKIVMALMEEKAKQDGGYHKIPLTRTSYVRIKCREKCFGIEKDNVIKGKRANYLKAIQTLRLTLEDYDDLKLAFQGGFTHANSWYSGDLVEKVSSFDFTSSYPTVLLTEKYPINRAVEWEEKYRKLLNNKQYFKETLEKYCCLMTLKFTNIREKFLYEHYISSSRCLTSGKTHVDNGRIIDAELLQTTITEQDYYIIEECYDWDTMEIVMFKTFTKGYLPTDFIKMILELYKVKTELKGVEDKKVEYMAAKGDLNSLYGMTVMDIIRDENAYDDDWLPENKDRDRDDLLLKYNNNQSRFLFYPWGVWCTAYARRNLFTGIFEFGEDYVYSDTDSIKVVNAVNHLEYFNKYNEQLDEKIKNACAYHHIDVEEFKPKTIDGVEKPIGVWDYEGTYRKFKTLGAKRYMYQMLNKKTWKDEMHLTVSGLDKVKALKYLTKKYKTFDKIFDAFKVGLSIPKGNSGKLTHTYIDDEIYGKVVDYRGVEADYHEKTAVHLEDGGYDLSISDDYYKLLMEILKLKVREPE